MPAWGTEGGGPLNSQQLDELVAYIEHEQISQMETVAGVDGRVDIELRRIEGADAALEAAIEAQRQNPYVEPFPTGLLTLGLFRVMAEARLGRTQVARARFAALESQIAQAPPSPERAALVEEARALLD